MEGPSWVLAEGGGVGGREGVGVRAGSDMGGAPGGGVCGGAGEGSRATHIEIKNKY